MRCPSYQNRTSPDWKGKRNIDFCKARLFCLSNFYFLNWVDWKLNCALWKEFCAKKFYNQLVNVKNIEFVLKVRKNRAENENALIKYRKTSWCCKFHGGIRIGKGTTSSARNSRTSYYISREKNRNCMVRRLIRKGSSLTHLIDKDMNRIAITWIPYLVNALDLWNV